MKAMRVAVIFDHAESSGGGYIQSLNAALIASQINHKCFQVFFYATSRQARQILGRHGIEAEYISKPFASFLLQLLLDTIPLFSLKKLIRAALPHCSFERKLIKASIDIVYFLSPSSLAYTLRSLNYILTVWDLCHLDEPAFPEVRLDYEFESRERYFQAVLPKATAVVVDSEFGRENIHRYYRVPLKRVHIIPFQSGLIYDCSLDKSPSIHTNANQFISFNGPYVFYPAQFWPHKNHVFILEGLRSLETCHGLIVGAVFTGRDMGNLAYVREKAKELGLLDRVCFLGFMPSNIVAQLCAHSLALVMPTYFGPTNLPPLEAFELGVPVLYPDLDGLREQVKSAALLINLDNPITMADHLQNLLLDNNLRETIAIKGRKHLEQLRSIEGAKVLEKILAQYRSRRLCWR